MILPDVNVLVYAAHSAGHDHDAYADWLAEAVAADEAIALADNVLVGVVRILTNGRIWQRPAPVADALAFSADLRAAPNAVAIGSDRRTWDVFADLCEAGRVTTKLIPDAFVAAQALRHDCDLLTADRGFARFPGLRFRDPVRR